MNVFFATKIEKDHLFLTDEEARHCVQVLRKKAGDPILVVDGKGGRYQGEITETSKRSCRVKILQKEQLPANRQLQLHLAIAPTKNINRFEWLLEKATEIGVEHIHPLLCEHSERKNIRPDRLQKILLAAMKQSQRSYLPTLHPLRSFSEFWDLDGLPQQRFIAHCADGPKSHFQDKLLSENDVLVLIGPEGDFSPREIETAQQAGAIAVHLGDTRLRTETAGILACAIVQLKNEIA